jgi:hypothetical protein
MLRISANLFIHSVFNAGGNPFPIRHDIFSVNHDESGDFWWKRIQPSEPDEHDLYSTDRLSPSMVESPDGHWSLFHNIKLALSLQTLAHSSIALRHRIKNLLQNDVEIGGSKGLVTVEMLSLGGTQGLMGIVSKAFNTCATLVTECSSSQSHRNSLVRVIDENMEEGGNAALTSGAGEISYPQLSEEQIIDKLLNISENLVCIMLDIVLTSSEIDVYRWLQSSDSSLKHSTEVALHFDTHSFIYQVGRWIKEKISQVERRLGGGQDEIDY